MDVHSAPRSPALLLPNHWHRSAACPLALKDPLVDVRIAAWLSTPDDDRLEDRGAPAVGRRRELFTLSGMLKCGRSGLAGC